MSRPQGYKMIDKILNYYGMRCSYEALGTVPPDTELLTKAQALTAIYEIGLGVIGKTEPETDKHGDYLAGPLKRNQLRASQRKAWAKACGVAEK